MNLYARTMNKRLLSVLMPALLLLLTAGCNIFETPTNTIPEGLLFYTDCPVSFYFVDEEGKDLVDPQDHSTFPLAYPGRINRQSPTDEGFSVTESQQGGSPAYLYNDNSNYLWKDSEENLWCFLTWVWGRTLDQEFKTYIYVAGQEDSLKVSFKYLKAGDQDSKDLPEGSSWGIRILSMRYNDIEIFENNEKGKVFIEKPSQGGETVVHVGSI